MKSVEGAKLSNKDGEFEGVFVAKDDESLKNQLGAFLTGERFTIVYPCGISQIEAVALQMAYQINTQEV